MRHQRLSAVDGSFLRVETSSAHMHVGWKGEVGERAAGPIGIAELRAGIERRLRHAPRFRQRLAFDPGRLAEPVWVDDERFDIRDHVRTIGSAEIALPRARFDMLCDELLSRPLHRSRPLWQIGFAPRLAGGGGGLLMKIHHAMVDGMSAVELALLLFDSEPEPVRDRSPDGWLPARAPTPAQLTLEALRDRQEEALRTAAGLARAATSPSAGLRLARTVCRVATSLGQDILSPAPPSYVNPAIGPRRTLVHHACAIAPLRAARRGQGATINEVALTVVAGALRRLAVAADAEPAALKVMVPVSLRGRTEAAGLGNRFAFVSLSLPVHVARAADRLAAIHARLADCHRRDRAATGGALMDAMETVPSPLMGPVARALSSPRVYNLTVSSVPGPRAPVFLLGAEMREAAPVIPIPDGHALAIGVFTYLDRICFGAYADPEALPQVAALPAALQAEIADLEHMGDPTPGEVLRAA